MKNPVFIFVVDADAYSGNWERQIAEYITGQPHNYGYGDYSKSREANPEYFEKWEDWFEQHVQSEHGEYGKQIQRLVATPNRFNNGLGGYYDATPENIEKALAARNAELDRHYQTNVENVERWVKEEKAKGGTRDHQKEADDRLAETKTKPLVQYPAYESVGILFNEMPPTELIEDMKLMAQKFTEYYVRASAGILAPETKLNIIGFRMLREEMTVKEISLNY